MRDLFYFDSVFFLVPFFNQGGHLRSQSLAKMATQNVA